MPLHKRIHTSSKVKQLRGDPFNFALLNDQLLQPTTSSGLHAGDGFDKHELYLLRRQKRPRPKATAKSSRPTLSGLTLISSAQIYDIPKRERRQGRAKPKHLRQTLRTAGTEHRASSVDIIISQFMTLTAPPREWRDSDESEQGSQSRDESVNDQLPDESLIDQNKQDSNRAGKAGLREPHLPNTDDMLLDFIEVRSSGSVQEIFYTPSPSMRTPHALGK
jgi:hypothetical protein